MDAVEQSPTPNAGSCVVEPVMFTHALRFLADPPDEPLTLEIFQNLRIICDACVLHEEVVCPNPHVPTFRHTFDVDSHDELKSLLLRNQNWSFVRTDYLLDNYGQTQWYDSTDAFGTNESVEQGLMQLEPTDSKAEDDDPTGSAILNDLYRLKADYERNLISYLDNVAAIGEAHQLTVVFDKFALAKYHNAYERLFIAPQFNLLREYDERLRTRVTKSPLARYRSVYHYAPMFLHKALADTAKGRRDGVLHAIAGMHDEFARPYRELFTHVLTTANQAEAERLLHEVERLLFSHADSDTPIPAAYGGKLLLYVLKIGASIASLLLNPLSLPGALKDTMDTVEASKSALDILPEKERRQVYHGLNFLNHFSPERPTARALYQELKKIFGDLAFTETDLNRHLAKS